MVEVPPCGVPLFLGSEAHCRWQFAILEQRGRAVCAMAHILKSTHF